jgi:hypothetical protein
MFGHWYVDIRFEGQRVRKRSPLDTRRGAQEYERQLRTKLLHAPEERKEVQPPAIVTPEVPTFDVTAAPCHRSYFDSGRSTWIQRSACSPCLLGVDSRWAVVGQRKRKPK